MFIVIDVLKAVLTLVARGFLFDYRVRRAHGRLADRVSSALLYLNFLLQLREGTRLRTKTFNDNLSQRLKSLKNPLGSEKVLTCRPGASPLLSMSLEANCSNTCWKESSSGCFGFFFFFFFFFSSSTFSGGGSWGSVFLSSPAEQ